MTITMLQGEINDCKKSSIPWFFSPINKCFITTKDSSFLVELFSSAGHNLGDDTLKVSISKESLAILDLYKSDNNKTSKVLVNKQGIMPVKIQKINISMDTISDNNPKIYLDARFNRPLKFNKMIIMNYDSIKGCVECKTDFKS